MSELTPDKFLNAAEVEALERVIGGDSRDEVMITIALKCGPRASELLGIKRGDINHQSKSIFIRGKKGSSGRSIPLKADLYHRLMRYVNTHDDERVFPISYPRLVEIWNIFKPAPKKFHSLRHTFALALYKKSKDIRLVKAALGHRSLTNTMIYLEYSYTDTEMRKYL
jgi:integrase